MPSTFTAEWDRLLVMTKSHHLLAGELACLDTCWPHAHAWAIDQMPSPAYCCSVDGHIVHRNAAADRIWGELPAPFENVRWDGFAKIRDLDGQPIAMDASPAARAALGESLGPVEMTADCYDGHARRVISHAKPIFLEDGSVAGSFCCLVDVSEKRFLEERSRNAAKAREEFLSMLAHELRNPLAPIMSVAGLLLRFNRDPAIEKMAAMVQRQSKQLSRFISDLLDASRLDRACELRVEPRSCATNEILALAMDSVEPAMRSRNQNLSVDIANRDAKLRCDPERIAQALGNVLSNASAFAPDGSEICLRVFIEGALLRVEVVDCGMGIGADDLPHIFVAFERRALAPGRAPVGAGLGLTIAKGVCEAHGGSIDVRSAGLGHGTTVSLALPVAVEFA